MGVAVAAADEEAVTEAVGDVDALADTALEPAADVDALAVAAPLLDAADDDVAVALWLGAAVPATDAPTD